jgi:hypothetical protein
MATLNAVKEGISVTVKKVAAEKTTNYHGTVAYTVNCSPKTH